MTADDVVILTHRWPVRRPRPIAARLDASRPFLTGQRVFDFLFPIAEGGTVSPNFADGYQISLIDDAIVESAASGNWVEVPLIES